MAEFSPFQIRQCVYRPHKQNQCLNLNSLSNKYSLQYDPKYELPSNSSHKENIIKYSQNKGFQQRLFKKSDNYYMNKNKQNYKQYEKMFPNQKGIIKRLRSLMLEVKDLQTKMLISKTISWIEQNCKNNQYNNCADYKTNVNYNYNTNLNVNANTNNKNNSQYQQRLNNKKQNNNKNKDCINDYQTTKKNLNNKCIFQQTVSYNYSQINNHHHIYQQGKNVQQSHHQILNDSQYLVIKNNEINKQYYNQDNISIGCSIAQSQSLSRQHQYFNNISNQYNGQNHYEGNLQNSKKSKYQIQRSDFTEINKQFIDQQDNQIYNQNQQDQRINRNNQQILIDNNDNQSYNMTNIWNNNVNSQLIATSSSCLYQFKRQKNDQFKQQQVNCNNNDQQNQQIKRQNKQKRSIISIISNNQTIQCECGLFQSLLYMIQTLIKEKIIKQKVQHEDDILEIDRQLIQLITQQIIQTYNKSLQKIYRLQTQNNKSTLKSNEQLIKSHLIKSLKQQQLQQTIDKKYNQLKQHYTNKIKQINIQTKFKIKQLKQKYQSIEIQYQNCKNQYDNLLKINKQLYFKKLFIEDHYDRNKNKEDLKQIQIQRLKLQNQLKQKQINQQRTIIQCLEKQKTIHKYHQNLYYSMSQSNNLKILSLDNNQQSLTLSNKKDQNQLKQLKLENILLKQQCILLQEQKYQLEIYLFKAKKKQSNEITKLQS